MARPLTRAQILENRAFLHQLRLTGNVRAAARACGLKYGTMQYRRARHPFFAQDWDVATASAQARLRGIGSRRPELRAAAAERSHRTAGGEPVILLLRNGTMQVRAAHPGKLTQACAQAFLAALAATANIRLAAAAAGASPAAFYRRRQRDPGFAREMKRALAEGYERLEMAMLARIDPCSFTDDGWTHNERPEAPPLTAAQALQLLYLHQKEVRLGGTPDALRRRRNESRFAHRARLDAVGRAEQAAEHERYRQREAQFRATGVMPAHEPPPPFVPDLSQVRGWSRATLGAHEGGGLFGRWSAGDQSEAARAAALRKGRERG